MINKYIFLGDSLVFGYGVQKKDSWVNLLKNNSNINIINKGINGNSTTDMLFRFTEDVISQSTSMVFIMGGTNDLLLGHSVESIINNILIMIKELKSNDIPIIIGIPPTIIPEDATKLFMDFNTYDYSNTQLPYLRDKLIALCLNHSLDYIDFYTLTTNYKNQDIFLDGIHLNSKGQVLMYNLAKEYFKQK